MTYKETKVQGLDKLRELVEDNSELYDEIRQEVLSRLKK